MGTKEHLTEALELVLEAGERIEAWRPVVANGRVEDSAYQTTLALLGPSVFSGRVAGGWAAQEVGHGTGFVGKANRD